MTTTGADDDRKHHPWVHRAPVLPLHRGEEPASHRYGLPTVREVAQRRDIESPCRSW